MPRRIFVFDPPDRFIAGTVGEPGDRTFYLQAQRLTTVVSVALEKVQVAVLAERLGALLDAIREAGRDIPSPGAQADVTLGGAQAADVPQLAEPVLESFRVAAMTLAWDDARDQVVIEARAASEDGTVDLEEDEDEDDDDEEGADLLRVRLTAAEALAFAEEAALVVAAGRLPCPLCGQPLNPEGHICPRRNGYVN
jgi:uncharacterized repeat protein (TIGR03847 family)